MKIEKSRFQFKNLEQQNVPKEGEQNNKDKSWWKEKNIREIQLSQNWFSEKTNKIDRLVTKKREKAYVYNVRNGNEVKL